MNPTIGWIVTGIGILWMLAPAGFLSKLQGLVFMPQPKPLPGPGSDSKSQDVDRDELQGPVQFDAAKVAIQLMELIEHCQTFGYDEAARHLRAAGRELYSEPKKEQLSDGPI